MYHDCPSWEQNLNNQLPSLRYYKMQRWILLAFFGLLGCNSYVDPDWYNKPAFTEHLGTLYAYPSVTVTPSKNS